MSDARPQKPAMTKPNEAVLQATVFSGVCGAYALGVSGLRLYELAQLPPGVRILPGFPQWLISYLWAICGSLFGIGLSAVALSLLILMHRVRSRELLLIPAACMALWIIVHGIFSLQDRAVGSGGLVWGVIDMVTLTRTVSEPTDAGLSGYRVGQVLGLLVWCSFPFALSAATGSGE